MDACAADQVCLHHHRSHRRRDLGRRDRHRRPPHHPDHRRRGEGRVNGKVCAFGADFQIIRPNELIELEAKYAFETDDGAVVYVENKGLRFGPVELLQKLKRGEPVDPKLIYFRTVPKFETGAKNIAG